MKVIAVLGSPREKSASSALAREVLRGAADAGHEVVIYSVNDMNLKGCQACGYCKDNRADCVIDDDLKPYWQDLHGCGALVLASPNYCSQVTGPMITFMNRHYCLMMKDGPRVHPGIKLVGVFSQGYSKVDAYTDAYRWYLHDFEARGMLLQDVLIHTGGTLPEPDSELMQRAYRIGKEL